MSGFKDEVISILRQNGMYHREALGLIKETGFLTPTLLPALQAEKFPVTDKFGKPVLNFDYVVLSQEYNSLNQLLTGLASLSIGGLLILEVTNQTAYRDRYVSLFGNFSVTKVKYPGRTYLVFRNGIDYGD